jgi:hypothetical protein
MVVPCRFVPLLFGYVRPKTVRDRPGLKMPDLGPYDAAVGSFRTMFRRWLVICGVIAFGLALSGCTKCGPIWDDWMQSPKSCKSDHF